MGREDKTKKKLWDGSPGSSDSLKKLLDRISELENNLNESIKFSTLVVEQRDVLKRRLEEAEAKSSDTLIKYKKDIVNLYYETSESMEKIELLEKEIEILKTKCYEYDKLKKSLSDIKNKAELSSLKIIEDAQVQAMESINIIDEVSREIILFKSDIERLRDDLKIGTATLEDRIDSMYYKINEYVLRMDKIKTDFYKVNIV